MSVSNPGVLVSVLATESGFAQVSKDQRVEVRWGHAGDPSTRTCQKRHSTLTDLPLILHFLPAPASGFTTNGSCSSYRSRAIAQPASLVLSRQRCWEKSRKKKRRKQTNSRQPTSMPTKRHMRSKALAKQGCAQNSISALQPFTEIERVTRA